MIFQLDGLGNRTLIMGVLNVTPDSFSDGGSYIDPDSAIFHGISMLEKGADIIDIGGESTRPATFRDEKPVSAAEEIARVLPVISGILASWSDAVISIDTYKADVAQKACEAGAKIINDVSGLGADSDMAKVAAKFGAYIVIMHMPGVPHRMPKHADYGSDMIHHINQYFDERIERALKDGVDKSRIILDPGIGFGKNTAQNCEIIRRLAEIKAIGFPVLSGPSRKRFIGELMGGAEANDRLPGTAAAVALSIANGADIVRVHDLEFIKGVVKVCDGIAHSGLRPPLTIQERL